MDEDTKDIIKYSSKMVALLVALVVVLLFGCQCIHILSDTVPITVTVDDKQVFSGPSYRVDIKSSGANTTVTLRTGFMAILPTEYYVSNRVVVSGKKPKSE